MESEDEKPDRLCQTCTERLLGAYDFLCAVEEAEHEIENFLRLEKHSEEQLQHLEENEDKEEMDVVEVESTNIDVEDIEILDDEFITDQDDQAKSQQGEQNDAHLEKAEIEQNEEIVIEEATNSEEIVFLSDEVM